MTPFLWGLGAGLVATHVLWALVWVVWWYLLIRRAGPDVHEQVTRDFRVIRNAVRRANARDRN